MTGGLGCTDKAGGSSYGGIAAEFIHRTQKMYPEGRKLPHCTRSFEPHVAHKVFDAMLLEAGVQLLKKHTITSVEVQDHRILRAVFANGTQTTTVSADVFIDASYEGDLMAEAGVSFTYGREGRSQYNETYAGRRPLIAGACYGMHKSIDGIDDQSGKPLPMIWGESLPPVGSEDKKVMSYNYRLCLTNSTDPSHRVEITEPDAYDPHFFEAPRRYMAAYPPGCCGW